MTTKPDECDHRSASTAAGSQGPDSHRKSSSRLIRLDPASSLSYVSRFVTAGESAELMNRWTTQLDWVQSEINLFGKKIPIPRLNAWYGERHYSYSGTRFEARPWTPELANVKQRVEDLCGLHFNCALINWYRDGQDSMGWHSDDEKSLGRNPQIASVSLGDQRRFVLRQKSNKSNKVDITLEDGSLLLMLGETQSHWQHALPRTKAQKNGAQNNRKQRGRVNLTFRLIE